ncbi:unnamed protein product [Oreochromis niloticus]|nr:unnamed protein product [Mustela putorius furo]
MATAAVFARFLLQKSTQGFLFSSRAVPAFSSPFLSRAHRLEPSDDELYQRTTVSVMQKDVDNGVLIHSYNSAGFNIDGNRVFGPCAVLPPAILQWKIGSSKDITEESVSLFHMLEPKIAERVCNLQLPNERAKNCSRRPDPSVTQHST